MMSQRVNDILAGLGDGDAAASLGGADAESVGLKPGSYTAKQIRAGLSKSAGKPDREPTRDPEPEQAAPRKRKR